MGVACDAPIRMNNMRFRTGNVQKILNSEETQDFTVWIRLNVILQKNLAVTLENTTRLKAFRAVAERRMK